jgi:hypothetical protein
MDTLIYRGAPTRGSNSLCGLQQHSQTHHCSKNDRQSAGNNPLIATQSRGERLVPSHLREPHQVLSIGVEDDPDYLTVMVVEVVPDLDRAIKRKQRETSAPTRMLFRQPRHRILVNVPRIKVRTLSPTAPGG